MPVPEIDLLIKEIKHTMLVCTTCVYSTVVSLCVSKKPIKLAPPTKLESSGTYSLSLINKLIKGLIIPLSLGGNN